MKTFINVVFGALLLNWISISDCVKVSAAEDLNKEEDTLPLGYFIAGIAAILAIQAAILRAFGQSWICKSGKVLLWTGDTYGSRNSQHLTDWYTFDHVLHGFIFYYLMGLLSSEDVRVNFLLAVTVESVWEILENSPLVINRYRETALAQGYAGDTIINSLSDNAAMAVGFLMSYFLPTSLIIVIAIAEEIILAAIIRDNLLLNVIQLIAPNKAISDWQSELIQDNKNTK